MSSRSISSVRAPTTKGGQLNTEQHRTSGARWAWLHPGRHPGVLWPVAILLSFPIGGFIADLVVDGVDSLGAALAAGAITGVLIGAAEWFALRKWVSWLWIPATTVGMAVGLAAGAALVEYGIDRADVVLMGAVTGVGVGVAQALVFARDGISDAYWWAVAIPPAWAFGWLVTSYVISTNVDERYPIFGASGAVVFGLLTWLLLAFLLGRTERSGRVAQRARPGISTR